MGGNQNLPASQRGRIHPLVAAAAVAVILVSGVGVAALTGILPTSKAVPAALTTPLVDGQVSGSTVPSSPDRQETSRLTQTPRQHRVETIEQNTAPSEAARAPAVDPYGGEVVAINIVRTAEPTTGLGALGGAVIGGLAGTQVGNGRGRTAATIVGALGGGLAGNTVEHAVHKETTYDVQVRMGDGRYRDFSYEAAPGLQIGQHVQVSGDSLNGS